MVRSSWCRFCGAHGLADRMVCADQQCQSLDLFTDLGLPGDIADAAMKVMPHQQIITVNQPPIAVMPLVMPQPQVTFDYYIEQRDPNQLWNISTA